MTKDSAEVAALGFIALLLALVSLGTVDLCRQNEDSIRIKPFAPENGIERSASSRALRALRRGQRIDLNLATAADLELLPGIGPKLAKRVIADRTKNGAYRDVKDLTRVSGIGPVTLSRIEHLLTTTDPKTEHASD
jgi:competence ComEA-like helix-hairpin-helix protein